MDAKKTGCFIAEKRKARNMSQRDLAKHLHITDKAISKWERGLSFPDINFFILGSIKSDKRRKCKRKDRPSSFS